jgi:formylglycine-generating enzyme required for sulfatase activity
MEGGDGDLTLEGGNVREGGGDYVATCVNWHDSLAFCKKLSTKEGKEYRLPTKEEWEWSCRAGSLTAWSFGWGRRKSESVRLVTGLRRRSNTRTEWVRSCQTDLGYRICTGTCLSCAGIGMERN